MKTYSNFFASIAFIYFSLSYTLVFGQNITNLEKLAILNYAKVSNEIGRSDFMRVNKYLADVAKASGIQIIHNDGAFVGKDVDITTQFIKGFKDGVPAAELDLSFLKINPSIAVVNREKVFSESKLGLAMVTVLKSEFTDRQNDLKAEAQAIKNSAMQLDVQASSLNEREKKIRIQKLDAEDRELQRKQKIFIQDLNLRTLEEREKIAKEANAVTFQLVNKLGLSIVFQDVAYLSPEFDLTSDVIALLNKDKRVEQIPTRPAFIKPARVAVVMSEQLYAALGDSTSMSNEERLKIRTELATKVNPILAQFAKSKNINVVLQRPDYADLNVDITAPILALMQSSHLPSKEQSSPKIDLEDFKQKCLDLGFRAGTEPFGKCVLRLSK